MTPVVKTIDAHQHFWDPARGGYEWFGVEGPSLRCLYGPADLKPLMEATGVSQTVLVQADGTLAETEYVLGLADQTDFVTGVVGFVDFENATAISDVKRLAANPKFKGLRAPIQGLPDVDWMFRDDVQWAYRAICDLGLTFDALGRPRHLVNFRKLAMTYAAMPIVLDHALKPAIASETPESFGDWADGMARLAQCANVQCKLSGLATEAGPDWTAQTLKPYVDHLVAVFGADRLMWGSNWPVDSLCGSYQHIHQTYRALTAHLAPEDQAQIFGGTARRFYRL